MCSRWGCLTGSTVGAHPVGNVFYISPGVTSQTGSSRLGRPGEMRHTAVRIDFGPLVSVDVTLLQILDDCGKSG